MNNSKSSICLVVVGASAGGLEALRELFSNISKIRNFAFVVAQHLSPKHESMLVNLLKSQLDNKVVAAKDDQQIVGGFAYITPPNAQIKVVEDRIKLSKPDESLQKPKPSVDDLLSSMAENTFFKRKVAIILSGTGSDGAVGLKALKAAGGYIIAQDPDSAKYDGMPRAAIQTELVDSILTPWKMGDLLAKLIEKKDGFGKLPTEVESSSEARSSNGGSVLSQILNLLEEYTGTNFTHYKKSTLKRRIEKRFFQVNMVNEEQYLAYVKSNPEELSELFKLTLIGVTAFFRDGAPFEDLQELLEKRLQDKKEKEAVRIWVPGCATGEEAYSIAIIVQELFRKLKINPELQIFASDIDDKAIQTARRGVYSEESLKGLSKTLLNRYFDAYAADFQVNNQLRSKVLFSRHDLTSQPPFLRLDLISCRNLLIYFDKKLQEYVLPIFHYALKKDGILLLGNSESLGETKELFHTENANHRLYRKKAVNSKKTVGFGGFKKTGRDVYQQAGQVSKTRNKSLFQKEKILQSAELSYVIINQNAVIEEISGNVNAFLKFRVGEMSNHLFKLLDEHLQTVVKKVVQKAFKEKAKVTEKPKAYKLDKQIYYLSFACCPIEGVEDDLWVLYFQEHPIQHLMEEVTHDETSTDADGSLKKYCKDLEEELALTKQQLQSYIEELETSNQELQSLNEEVQSTNEELQSSNEELETANEELQSTNEEVQIAYGELKKTNEHLTSHEEELKRLNIQKSALLNNTRHAFMLLDLEGKILELNPVAQKNAQQFSKKKPQSGSSLVDYAPSENAQELLNAHQKAVEGELEVGEMQVKNEADSYWLNYAFHPIKDAQKQVVMVAYNDYDFTDLKNTQISLKHEEDFINSLFRLAGIGICVTDENARFVKVNKGYLDIYGYEGNELIGQSFSIVVPPGFRKSALENHEEFLESGHEMPTEWKVVRKDGKEINVYVTATLLKRSDGKRFKITTVRDVSESHRYKNLLQSTEATAKVGGWEYDLISESIRWTPEVYNIYGLEEGNGDVDLKQAMSYYDAEDREKLEAMIAKAIDDGEPYDLELKLFSADKKEKWVRTTCKPIRVYDRTVKLFGTIQDISQRKSIEMEMQKLSFVASKVKNMVLITDSEQKIEWVNEAFTTITGYTFEEALGKNPNFLQGKDTDPKTRLRISNKIKAGQPFQEEILNYTKSGEPYWNQLTITPVKDDNGKVVNYISIQTDITNRKRYEQEVRFQANILSQIKDAALATNLDFEITYANRQVEVFYEINTKEIKGHHVSVVFDFPQRQAIKNHLENHTVWSDEFLQTTHAGKQFYVEMIVSKLMDMGEHVGYLLLCRDIDVIKRERIKLDQLSVALEETNNEVYMFDGQTLRFFYFNKAVRQNLGYTAKELYNMTPIDITTNLTEDKLKNQCSYLMTSDTNSLSRNTKHRRKDGSTYQASVDLTYAKLDNSRFYLAIVTDITEQIENEQKLLEAYQELKNFRAALDKSAIVSMTDKKGRITYVNRAFCEVSKYEVEELLGQKHSIVNSGYHNKVFWKDLWQHLAKGISWRGEILNKAKDGSTYWVDTVINPIVSQDNEVKGYLSIRYLIDSRKKAEEERHQLIEDLTQKNRNLQEFTYIVSHNLRAPLANILGLVDILVFEEEVLKNKEVNKIVQNLQSSANSLDEVIKDVNHILTLRDTIKKTGLEKLEFASVFHEVKDKNKPLLKDVDCQIMPYFEKAPEVFFIKNNLQNILEELLLNAIKFRDASRKLNILVRTYQKENYVVLEFDDNGLGINLSGGQEKVFGLYNRLHPHVEGKGLGLFLVKRMIEELGGKVEVESKEEKGTTFRLYFKSVD